MYVCLPTLNIIFASRLVFIVGPYNSSPLDICTLFSHHTVSSASMQTMILIRNDDLIRTVPPTPTLSTPSTPEWGNCFPSTCIIPSQPPQHEMFAIVPIVHPCSLCSPSILPSVYHNSQITGPIHILVHQWERSLIIRPKSVMISLGLCLSFFFLPESCHKLLL